MYSTLAPWALDRHPPSPRPRVHGSWWESFASKFIRKMVDRQKMGGALGPLELAVARRAVTAAATIPASRSRRRGGRGGCYCGAWQQRRTAASPCPVRRHGGLSRCRRRARPSLRELYARPIPSSCTRWRRGLRRRRTNTGGGVVGPSRALLRGRAQRSPKQRQPVVAAAATAAVARMRTRVKQR
jgi:hypothetical protein